MNILNQFHANDYEKKTLINHFKTTNVTHTAVNIALKKLREI